MSVCLNPVQLFNLTGAQDIHSLIGLPSDFPEDKMHGNIKITHTQNSE